MPPFVRRSLVALGALAGLAGLAVGALQWAPLYRLAPHAPRDLDHLFGEAPLVVAHRGWSAIAPENTMRAFERAASMGLPFELDVHLAATGEVVVLHDDTLDRTTDGRGPVAEADLEALAKLDAGAWFDAAFTGEPLPTLDAVLARFGGEVLVDIELKTTPRKAALAEAVVAVVRKHRLVERVMVSSFDPYLLGEVARVEPGIARGLLVGSFESADLAWHEKRALRNLLLNGVARPDLIMPGHDILTPEWLAWLRGQGYRVMVWTVDEPAAIRRWIEAGIDGVITNTPDRALALLDAAP